MYHLQLRQFPHNLCRFNLTEAELRLVVEPWAHDHWVELGERKWSPYQAKITILEGPQMPVQQLSMGRGWRNAERSGQDVTERLLVAAKQAPANEPSAPLEAPSAISQPPATGPSSEPTLLADSLGLELLSLLEDASAPLSQAWSLAQARLPDRTASESLALAERAVASLLGRRLIVLVANADGSAAPGVEADAGGAVEGEAIESALRALESWAPGGQPGAIRMRRA